MSSNKLYQQGIKTGITKCRVFLLILLLNCSVTSNLSAQQLGGIIGLMPMQYNSSFAGNTGGTRISLLTQATKQNKLWSDKYGGMAVSYDKFIPAIGSGLGVYVSGFSGRGGYKEESSVSSSSFETGIVLAPKLSIRGKYTLSPSIALQYNHMNYMEGESSIVNVIYDTISKTYNVEQKYNEYYLKTDLFKLSGSLLFNSQKFYAGISYHYPLNKRFESGKQMGRFYNEYEQNNKFWYLQTGYRFQKRDNSKFSFNPQLLLGWFYVDKLKYNEFILDLNLTARYKKVIFGLAGGMNSGLQALLGYQNDRFRITYSQNFLFTKQFYMGELSLRYIIPSRKNVKFPNY